MKLGQYSVIIPQGIEDSNGYVAMQHNTKYCVRVHNGSSLPVAVQIDIDGYDVGSWRIEPRSTEDFEHSIYDDGWFTFYKYGTNEGQSSALQKNSNLGLIQCTITPSKTKQALRLYEVPTSYSGNNTSEEITTRNKYSAGGTGVSGHSEQQYGKAEPFDFDYDKSVVISLRLVCDEREYEEPRPLRMSNPVPPAIM